MKVLGSLWTSQEQNENINELKQKLLYKALELESLKKEAKEEIMRNEENIRNLVKLVKTAYNERDEARDQLQNVLQKLAAAAVRPKEVPNVIPHVQPESPVVLTGKANSSITESNSFSETHNHRSHGSSPVNSFLDTVTSPEFSNISAVDPGNYNCFVSPPIVSPVKNPDPGDAVIDNLVRGKPLPQKGNLLQAVVKAGTTLQTLLVAGPLPSWRNPPPPQHLKIPPLDLKIFETPSNNQSSVANKSQISQKLPCISSLVSPSLCNFQSYSASTMNFSTGPYNPFLSTANDGVTVNNQVAVSKRQKLR